MIPMAADLVLAGIGMMPNLKRAGERSGQVTRKQETE